MMIRRRNTSCVFIATLARLIASAAAAAELPDASVVGPIPYDVGTHDFPWMTVPDLEDLAAEGYVEQEFFIDGSTGGEAYRTRLLVRRPIHPQRFNGTVVVEWYNVSGGFDINVSWGTLRKETVRGGYAYVGVSAQPVGVAALIDWDPVRYGGEGAYATLAHPALPEPPFPGFIWGDVESDDIFSQVGRAIRVSADLVLGGLQPERLLAAGQSQSAMRLNTYVNDHHPDPQFFDFDGYIIHGGGGLITNLDVPVFLLNSENEVTWYYRNRDLQPASVRYWEVAGTGHAPAMSYLSEQIMHLMGPSDGPSLCYYDELDDYVPIVYAGNAVLHHLDRWVTDGTLPPEAPYVDVTLDWMNRPQIERDGHGNALGGLRMPQLEAPLGRAAGRNSALIPGTDMLCMLLGGYDAFDGEPADTTPDDPWDEPTLDELYPERWHYLWKVLRATRVAVWKGWILPFDGIEIMVEALKTPLP